MVICAKLKLVLLSVLFVFFLGASLQAQQYTSVLTSELKMLNQLFNQQMINLNKARLQIKSLQDNLKNLENQLNQALNLSDNLTIQLTNLKESMMKQTTLLKNTLAINELLKKSLSIILPIAIIVSIGIGIALGIVIEYNLFNYNIIKL